jgi:hypothetical protein
MQSCNVEGGGTYSNQWALIGKKERKIVGKEREDK